MPEIGQVWALWKSDHRTLPVLEEWITNRKSSFGCSSPAQGKKFIRSSIIEWAFETRVKAVMLEPEAPRVGTANASKDTIYGLSSLWLMRQLMIAKPSFFPNSKIDASDWTLHRYDLVHTWMLLAFFWKQVTSKKVPTKAQEAKPLPLYISTTPSTVLTSCRALEHF
ncbi:uncharacterized protein LDX57_008364 [Aspergillus melleus]|uniref:uncharacterized protein n=1 Tax=Aspergillus melleus TaxID=138277 RepID=UPI001E8E9AF6|nr:uncharacterized protein LDX57_008364 [Aspergillus melleus]KAH8430702.1 hypothetical protein LDX57_008364 [Aspergillus melleus]